jgi:tRNA(Ile)-lysidine synthase
MRWRWELGTWKRGAALRFREGTEWFDAAEVGERVTLRHWRRGDRFQPIGMERAVKLQDLFTNMKVPREERHRRVVAVTEAGMIWWVEGLRIGEMFKIEPGTRRCLKWTWKRDRQVRKGS